MIPRISLLLLLLFPIITTSQRQGRVDCLFLEGRLRHTDESRKSDDIVYRCMTVADQEIDNMGGMVYDIPDSLLSKLNLTSLESGVSKLSISDAIIHRTDDFHDLDRIIATEESTVEVYEDSGRRLTIRTKGVSKVLVVRVSGLDTQPVLTRSELETRFFDENLTTFASQYDRCSNGALKFVPATFESSSVIVPRGVAEITIKRNLVGEFMTPTIENELFVIFQRTYGDVNNYDHVLYCMPSGLDQDWIGYTYGKTYRSYFNDEWCGYYTLPFHEVGHNLGLKHSGEVGAAYEDRSCLMGVSYAEVFGYRMCFNAHKFFLLDWFPERTVSVDPSLSGPWRGNLVAFVDVGKIENLKLNSKNVVVIKVGDLYIVYNRAKDYNDEVQEARDKVSIVQADGPNSDSFRLAALDTNSPIYTRTVPLAKGVKRVVIELCRAKERPHIDLYSMSIHLEGQVSACDISAAPSRAPQLASEATSSLVKGNLPIPSSSIQCDDDPYGTFNVPNLQRTEKCVWLAANPEYQPYLCRQGSEAFTLCSETCKRCSDDCEDTPGGEFSVTGVDGTSVKRSCLWLALRPEMNTFFCTNGSDATIVCGETCNTCDQLGDPVASLSIPAIMATPDTKPPAVHPTMAPAPLVEVATMAGTASISDRVIPVRCNDSRGQFFVGYTGSFQTCEWLTSNPRYQVLLCQQSDILGLCGETCEACSTKCHDDPVATFPIASSERDCDWLKSRPAYNDVLCIPGTPPYDACQETCSACGGPQPSVRTSPQRQSRLGGKSSCGDLEGTFPVASLNQDKDCLWLSDKPGYHPTLCAVDQPAYTLCRQTCGKGCACVDSDVEFVSDGRRYTCKYLAKRTGLQDDVCDIDHESQAAMICPKTCNQC